MDSQQKSRIEAALIKPRFLFRAGSDASRGGPSGNTDTLIDPLAGYEHMRDGQYLDYFTSMTWDRADAMVHMHLQQHNEYLYSSAFISWSISLVWVIVHAARKAFIKNEKNVTIYVLDTTKIQCDRRVFSPQKLVEIFNLNTRLDLTDSYKLAEDEFLVYGKMTNADGFSAVKLDLLYNIGLFTKLAGKLDPRRSNETALFQRIIGVRTHYYPPRRKKNNGDAKKGSVKTVTRPSDGLEAFELLAEYFPLQRALARCFGAEWESTMTLAFASIRRRDIRSDGCDAMLQDLAGLPSHVITGEEARMDGGVEEAKQFLDMLCFLEEVNEDALASKE